MKTQLQSQEKIELKLMQAFSCFISLKVTGTFLVYLTHRHKVDSHFALPHHIWCTRLAGTPEDLGDCHRGVTASGMNEMAAGAERVNLAVNNVNDISRNNREAIDILIKEVSRFKVE